MLLVPMATKGNYFHVYDFRVKPGRGDEFIELFNKFDYGDNNPFHQSRAQVKDGVLCRDAADPDHFYLIGEWRDIDEHRRIRELVAGEIRPEFIQLIEGGHFVPTYAEIVSMTPQEVLDKAAAEGTAERTRPTSIRSRSAGWPCRRATSSMPRGSGSMTASPTRKAAHCAACADREGFICTARGWRGIPGR